MLGLHDAFLYCNAMSEMNGLNPAYTLDPGHTRVFRSVFQVPRMNTLRLNVYVNSKSGFRLPTETEWEYAARNADAGHTSRFPWGDHISHGLANYIATGEKDFDLSVGGVHPDYSHRRPPIADAKTFPPHGYQNRFYGLIGNVADWVLGLSDPQPEPESLRLNHFRLKGGGWERKAEQSVIGASRDWHTTPHRSFRVVLPGAGKGDSP